MKKRNKIQILLFLSIVLFLFIYPWTKEVTVFRAEDVNWDILKSVKKTNVFDKQIFAFNKHYELNKKIKNLNGKKIRIKGFLKKESHNGHIDFLITETVTNVCFICDHDEHYNMIQLFPKNNELKVFKNLKNDSLIQTSGIFKISENNTDTSFFSMINVELIK